MAHGFGLALITSSRTCEAATDATYTEHASRQMLVKYVIFSKTTMNEMKVTMSIEPEGKTLHNCYWSN